MDRNDSDKAIEDMRKLVKKLRMEATFESWDNKEAAAVMCTIADKIEAILVKHNAPPLDGLFRGAGVPNYRMRWAYPAWQINKI